ncbi:MAG: adenylate/guanylate cyclase domain-containing protein [Mycobacteriales bacterium]
MSLLFGDLVGFTPIAESKDPEAVREMLSAYFERSRAVIERYGGVVEKFIGDAVFAVWGVPAAREDDAERAVRAGLDLTSTVTALGEELGIPELQMRVGITTGQVAVTLGVVGEGMVAGDAVNTAARVQSVAGPSQVWVDDTTRSLTTAALAYASMGEHELKGKAAPVELFHATRTIAGLGGEQRVDGLEAPFVGRDRELRMVKELFHATVEEGRPRLVLVAGEPGIGKSRLAWEFEKYVAAIPTTTTWWLRARCLSYGDGVAGRVIAELFRYLFRLADSDDDATVRETLSARLAQHVADEAERDVLRPRMESLLGLSDQAFEQADLFACWRVFLEALPEETAPSVTILIEDFQWADDGLRQFVDHLLEAAKAAITIVALARPEAIEQHPGLGVGRRSTMVFLEPLADPAMELLLDGLVANLPKALRQELVSRAEGVPLYAVETVRALIDRDVAVPSGGRYVIDAVSADALDLAALGPPATLQALLASRLDALPDDERRVVQDASVLGQSFTMSGIRTLTPEGIDLDAVLESLRRREILSVDNDPRSPERGQFRFVQALLRGVAYDTLSRRDRRARHLAVASYLAAQPDADSLSGVIASHFVDAIESMPDADDAGELKESAIAQLERAAQHAMAVGSPALALTYCARLLDLEPADEVTVRVTRTAIRLTAQIGADLDRGLAWARHGEEAAKRLGDEGDLLWMKLAVVSMLLNASQGDDALPIAQEVYEASHGRADRIGQLAEAVRALAMVAQNRGDPSLAQSVAIESLADLERFGRDEGCAMCLASVARGFGLAGFRRMGTVVRRAAAASYDVRSGQGLAPLANLATLVVHDSPPEAKEIATLALTEGRQLGLNHIAVSGHLIAAKVAMGEWAEARALVEAHRADGTTSLLEWENYLSAGAACIAWGAADAGALYPVPPLETRDPVVTGWQMMHDAVETALNGDLREGALISVNAVRRAAEFEAANEDVPLVLALAVDMLIAAGDMPEELVALTELLEPVPIGQRYRLLHGTLLRARAHLEAGRAGSLRAAISVFEQMGAAYWAARTRVDLAKALQDAGDPGVPAALDAAEPVLLTAGANRALTEVVAIREHQTSGALTP